MALSAEQKKQLIELLAEGRTEKAISEAVGCSRSTVQRLKKDAATNSLVQIARGLAATKQVTNEGEQVFATLETLKEREPQIQQGLWDMFEGLQGLFREVLERTDPADISPRQLPALVKAAADVADSYANYTDRINGLDALTHEIEKLNQSRSA